MARHDEMHLEAGLESRTGASTHGRPGSDCRGAYAACLGECRRESLRDGVPCQRGRPSWGVRTHVRLAYFHYYFTMTGKVRNLYSIDCQFQPILPDGASETEVKACAQELVEVYMDKLDRVFRKLVKGTRKPFLEDFPNKVTVGYQFEGRIRKLPLAILTRRARSVFACQAMRDPRWPRIFYPLEATIDCTYRKQGRHVRSGEIAARLQLGHMLNLCFSSSPRDWKGLRWRRPRKRAWTAWSTPWRRRQDRGQGNT